MSRGSGGKEGDQNLSVGGTVHGLESVTAERVRGVVDEELGGCKGSGSGLEG